MQTILYFENHGNKQRSDTRWDTAWDTSLQHTVLQGLAYDMSRDDRHVKLVDNWQKRRLTRQ